MTLRLPRYIIPKVLADGTTGFYFNVPTRYRKLGCTVPNEPLGTDYGMACGDDGNGGRAAALNALFDEWDALRRGLLVTGERAAIYGTIRWLFQEYRRSKAYLEKVAPRSVLITSARCISLKASLLKRAISWATAKSGRCRRLAQIKFMKKSSPDLMASGLAKPRKP
jgi:hypothetical protein